MTYDFMGGRWSKMNPKNQIFGGKSFTRNHSRFFVRVGHETTYASNGNHHFFTVSFHYQTYQNYLGI